MENLLERIHHLIEKILTKDYYYKNIHIDKIKKIIFNILLMKTFGCNGLKGNGALLLSLSSNTTVPLVRIDV